MTRSTESVLVDCALRAMSQDMRDEIEVAKRHIIDVVGVTLGGCGHPTVKAMIDAMEFANLSSGMAARQLGSGLVLSMQGAAAANAMAGHMHDYDDDDPIASLGHPTVVVFNAALAVAEAHDLDALRMIKAYIAGVEVMMRIGLVANPDHYNAGWHSSPSMGIFGAAVAAGLLMNATPEQMENALCIASSLAGGIKNNYGSDMKPIQVGLGAADGISAARLAVKGIRASRHSLFGKTGFLAMTGSTRDPDPVIAAFGKPYCLVSPGLNIKIYPCCSSNHTAIDGLLELVRKHRLSFDDMAQVDAWIGKDARGTLIYDVPETGFQGKFSMKYTLAVTAKYGAPKLSDYEDEAVRKPPIVDAMKKVNVHIDDDMPRTTETAVTYAARVRVTTTSGERFEIAVDEPKGSPSVPLSEADLMSKFMTLAEPVLGERAARQAFERLSKMDLEKSSRKLVDILVPERVI
ncbi:MAG: MmgE/PrpD family protein [Pseudorhodoplanes sp.]